MIPGSANPLLLATAAAGGYSISRSLRFNSSDSVFLSRTPASAGNRKTWTWAGWVKRSALGSNSRVLFGTGNAGNDGAAIRFNGSDQLEVYEYLSGSFYFNLITTQVFRDPAGFGHLVVAVDTSQATSSNRVKIYWNGTQITTFSTSTYPSPDYLGEINTAVAHGIGRGGSYNDLYFNGYLADIHFIDGQALDPTSFGEFDDNGIWQPKAFAGSYGTNGFHLDFADNASTTTIGYDAAGSNDWTANNLSVTAGAGNDSLVDVPTNGAQTDTGAGGEVRGNYCTWNPLKGAATLANGNLDATTTSAGSQATVGTFGITSGKWYWEVDLTVVSGTSAATIGIANNSFNATNYVGNDAGSWGYYSFDGTKYNNGSGSSYGNSYGNGDVIGVAFDADAGSLYFYKNGTVQNSGTAAFTGLTAGPYMPAVGDATSSGAFTFTLNAGARPFAYTAPSGFKALNTANLPAPVVTKPNTVMDVKLYTGNGSTNAITGLGFSPDFVWLKRRNLAASHNLFDIVRGATKFLGSDGTNAEQTGADRLTSFDSTGFTLGSNAEVNNNNDTYVGWAWDAGSSTVTNTQGSITGTVSVRANATAGFSIVTYTGNGSAATVGHGLGVAPALIIVKNRLFAGGTNWQVYHTSIGNTKSINLNTTGTPNTDIGWWNNTSPTSTVFSIGSFNSSNGDTFVAYCFAPVSGYSSFGSYTGNGSTDGPFVYTGFRPRWVMLKRTDSLSSWIIYDTSRQPANPTITYANTLRANTSDAESGGTDDALDIVSSGFKIRDNRAGTNASGGTFIWVAFAESPFQYARAR